MASRHAYGMNKYLGVRVEIYHIHTARCKHAAGTDEEYIEAAIKLGADRIVFTDHAPFPGNPFGNRMDFSELEEYIDTFNRLKDKYKDVIEIRIGLEVEYLPRFMYYYKQLTMMDGMDDLIIGQHFYQKDDGYSFRSKGKSISYEDYIERLKGLTDAMIEGMETGLFVRLAHPDRMFRHSIKFDDKQRELSIKLIDAAMRLHIPMEINASSIVHGRYFPEFWKLVPEEAETYVGLDAHSPEEVGYYVRVINEKGEKIQD